MTEEQRKQERSQVLGYLADARADVLVQHLRRRWRDGPGTETSEQMLNRLGRLDALADLERLREEAKGA